MLGFIERVSNEELGKFQPLLLARRKVLRQLAKQGRSALYKRATDYVVDSIKRAEKSTPPDLEEGRRLVGDLVKSIARDSAPLRLATDREQDFTVSTHCVNVAILAVRVGIALNYVTAKQINLGLAGLLHEIGVVMLPKRMLFKPGEVRVSSRVKKRPSYSADILAELCPEEDWLIQTVAQIYEREDGSGTPQGLKGKQIRQEAKLLGIADVLEASIHNRPYREALTGHQLLEDLAAKKDRSFSRRVVNATVRNFTVYPYNEYVILTSGELAQVVEVNPRSPRRPVVKILYSSSGRLLKKPRKKDLAASKSASVNRSVTAGELPKSS